jgi:hypothetical protein
MAEDPRDPVGQNPTGRPRRSSAGSRRKAEQKMERDLGGTRWGRKTKEK